MSRLSMSVSVLPMHAVGGCRVLFRRGGIAVLQRHAAAPVVTADPDPGAARLLTTLTAKDQVAL